MDNRQLLLECAKELFCAKGYDAVGVQEIVDRAGLTKPTLYYYFGSKLGLLKMLMDMKCGEFIGELKAFRKQDAGICESLYKIAGLYCDFFERDREFYMLMMALYYSAQQNEASQAVRPYVTDFFGFVVQIFEQASGELGNMHGRQKQFAIGFTGMMNTYFLTIWQSDPAHESRISQEQITSLVNQFMYGIFS